LRVEGQGKKEKGREWWQAKPVSTTFLLCLLFNPENGDGILPRNVELSPKYTALQHKDCTSILTFNVQRRTCELFPNVFI
jgi:hypothetical protein